MIPENVKSFFDKSQQIAIIGVSENKKKFGRTIYDFLKENGYNVVPVNPSVDKIENDICYNSIESLPDTVKKAVIATSSGHTDNLLKEISRKGIRDVWIQQMSETKESKSLADDLQLNVIMKRCVYMHAEPVKGIHSFHKALLRFFGMLK